MTTPEDRLKSLGYDQIDQPKPPSALAWFQGAVVDGRTVYASGHTSGPIKGKVPSQVPLPEAKRAAAAACVSLLQSVRLAVGSLDRIERVIRVTGYVNADADFHQVSDVIHGASELLVAAFGEQGKHARTALGVAQLPTNTAVEIEAIFRLKS